MSIKTLQHKSLFYTKQRIYFNYYCYVLYHCTLAYGTDSTGYSYWAVFLIPEKSGTKVVLKTIFGKNVTQITILIEKIYNSY